MNRTNPPFALLLALCLAPLLGAGCADAPREPADAPPEDSTEAPPAVSTPDGGPGVALAEILAAARHGDARALLQRLAAPQHIDVEPQQNRHNPAQTDTVRTYHFDGLELTIYHVQGGAALFEHLTVSAPGYETAEGLRVGSTRADVEAALGTPDVRTADGYEYELGNETPNPLQISFEGDTVSRMRWDFYVD